MTVDVEDYFHVAAFFDHIERASWDSYESRVGQNTRRLLRIFEQAEIQATFFVLGWVADRHPEVIREIDAAGHEIACHGYSHELVYRQTPEVFEAEARKSKSILEDITGKPVLGYRASTYSITPRSLWALEILAEIGFEYDSSLFPIRHDFYGVPAAPRFPHKIRTHNGATLLEFPLTTARMAGATVPVAGGGYFRFLPYPVTRAAFRRINRQEDAPFIFYLHPWEVDPDQPRIKASLRSRFRHYNNLHRTEGRLRRLLGDFQFSTVHSVLAEAEPAMATVDVDDLAGRNKAA